MYDKFADKETQIQVEFQNRTDSYTLYVHVDGKTVLRIQGIQDGNLEYTYPESMTKRD